MRTIILSLFILISGTAVAKPESISYSCNGRQQVVGGVKEGKIDLMASTPGFATYGNPWTLNVSWQGGETLAASGLSCGQPLPAKAKCSSLRSMPNLPFDVIQGCGKDVHSGSVPHSEFISSIVLDGDKGYFNCQSPKVHMHIQLWGCVPQTAGAEVAL